MAKVPLMVYVDEELREAAHEQKQKTGRTISHVVSEALRKWVAEDSPSDPQACRDRVQVARTLQ